MNANLRNFALWVIIVLLLLALFTLFQNPGQRAASQDISFSQLLTEVDQGHVRDVVIQGPEIHGTFTNGSSFQTYAPNDPSLVTRLLQRAAQKLNATLAQILYFAPADTIRCRRLLFGKSHIVALSHDTASEWGRALSDAEKRVVAAVLRGYTNREIAAIRGRSVRTIVNQLASALEKLSVRSRRELLSRLTGLEQAAGESG